MHMVRDSNNNIGGFEQLLQKNKHLDSFMYNLILPFETCQHLFKRCSIRNMKFTFSCLTFIKHMRYVTTDNKLHNGTQFAEKYGAFQLNR